MSKNNKFPLKSVSVPCAWCRSIAVSTHSQWAAVQSIAPKIGCSAHTLVLDALAETVNGLYSLRDSRFDSAYIVPALHVV